MRNCREMRPVPLMMNSLVLGSNWADKLRMCRIWSGTEICRKYEAGICEVNQGTRPSATAFWTRDKLYTMACRVVSMSTAEEGARIQGWQQRH